LVINQAVADAQPKLLIIDGVRDLIDDFNDTKATNHLVTYLEKITKQGTSIITVLHLNKTDGNARGHLGSELLNKSYCTMELTAYKNSIFERGYTKVECKHSRAIPFDDIAFEHDDRAMPKLLDAVPVSKTKKKSDEDIHAKILDIITKPMTTAELKAKVIPKIIGNDKRFATVMKELVDSGKLFIDGNPKSSRKTYQKYT
jgi:hypothetical protein